MKKFTKITLIIAAVFACVGIVLCCVATTVAGGIGQLSQMAQNGELNFGNWHFEDGVYYQGDENFLGNGVSVTLNEDTLFGGIESLNTTYDEEIDKIELELDAGNVVVKAAEQDRVSVSVKNGFRKHYSQKLEGNKLTVTYDVKGINYKESPEIIVYIPDSSVLEEIEIEADMGNVEIWDLEQGCENLDITAKMGNIEVHNSLVKEECKLKANMGNASMTEVICEKAELHAAMGAVSFEGIVNGDLSLTTDMGSAKAIVEGSESDYNIYLDADMGKINYNGKNHQVDNHNNSYECKSANARGDIYMESSMGEVDLTFR